MSEAPATKPKHTPTLLAWCAGVLESEGWVTICTRRANDRPNLRYRLSVGVTNSDLDMLTPFVEIWGGRLRPRKGTALTRKQCFEWRLEDAKAEACLRAIVPYVRGRKRDKVAAALRLRDMLASQKRTRSPYGTFNPKTTEELSCLSKLVQ